MSAEPTSVLLRNARLVPLAPGDAPPDGPVDVLVEHGQVTAVGPGLSRPGSFTSADPTVEADGRWLVQDVSPIHNR